MRNPSYHEMLRNTYRNLTNQLNEMANKIQESIKQAKREGREFLIPKESTIDKEASFTLEEWNKSMKDIETENGHIKIAEDLYLNVREIASYIQKMSLHIIEASGRSFFITSDTPLVLFSLSSGTPLGAGWANQDAMATISIHPKKCLILVYRETPSIYTGRSIVNTQDVDVWNINLMKYASNEVYSKYEYGHALNWMLRRGIWKE